MARAVHFRLPVRSAAPQSGTLPLRAEVREQAERSYVTELLTNARSGGTGLLRGDGQQKRHTTRSSSAYCVRNTLTPEYRTSFQGSALQWNLNVPFVTE